MRDVLVWVAAIAAWGGGVWAAYDVLMRGRTPQGTLAWILALLAFPPLALPLYFILGERRFSGYRRGRLRGPRPIDDAARRLTAALDGRVIPTDTDADWRTLTRLGRIGATSGNNLELLIDGVAFFDALLREIGTAERYVLVQFYIFRDDRVGGALGEALCRAAARGVEVSVLYDELGCLTLSADYFQRLRDAGCKCTGFRAVPRRRKPLRLNFRNHRKIVVVDGRVGFFGGLNVGDEYLGRVPEMGAWRDTHLRVSGPAVLCLQMVFLEDWTWANEEMPKVRWDPPPAAGSTDVLVLPTGPADQLDSAALFFLHMASRARERLWVATPYFVPDPGVEGALQLAALRGVDVRVIMPRNTDNIIVKWASLCTLEELPQHKVRLFAYERGVMHQKVVVSDDLAAIGSANLDNRSMRINFELMGVVRDPAVVERVAAMLEKDLESSREFPPDAWRRLGRAKRIKARLASLLGPML